MNLIGRIENVAAIASLRQRFPILGQAFRNSGWIFACGILSNATAFVASVLVARHLGATEIGAIGFAASIIAIVRIFASLGLDEVALREISQDPGSSARIIHSCLLIRFASTILVLPAIAVTALVFTPDALQGRVFILLLLSIGLIGVPFSSASIFYASRLRASVPQIINASLAIIYMIAVALGVYLQWSVIYFVSVISIQQILSGWIVYQFYRSEMRPTENWKSVQRTTKSLIRDSWPQTLSGFGILVQAYSDQIMLGEMSGLDSVAQYSISLKMTGVLAFMPLAILTSFMPSLSKRFKADRELFWVGFHQANRLASVVCLALITIVYLVGAKLVLATFGIEYLGASALFFVMSLRICLTSIGVLRSSFLVNANILRYSLLTVIAGTVLNIVLNLLWIPNHHEFGAVYASLVSFSVTTIVIDLCFLKTRQGMLIALRGWLFPFLNYKNQFLRI
ncbi:Polysaccharide biosynthesis protein [Rubripirellula tenax]|uniref:Polysaccharide biosynthesis protein n=1 Tax=Rubripirellula tenax TaxID=2528015 RepID=A0A5C6EGJ4_9BACT|nr:flippase [Rubripirellula tenax]TWU47565.1 Polysaccharide biosynthesis protein [Rubripirellula tenax]